MGKKKPTRPARTLQLVPTLAEPEHSYKLDQQTSDELKALIKKIASNGKNGKRTPDEDPQLPPAA